MNGLIARAARRAAGVLTAKTGLRVVRTNFYSPFVDATELAQRPSSFWTPDADTLGIDFRESEQRALLERCASIIKKYDYLAEGAPDTELQRFYDGNSQFGHLDARMLFALLQLWQPQHVIEVGSGYSTVLMDDVNRRHLGGAIDITAIEPFPRPFMHTLAKRGVHVLIQKVQDVDPRVFQRLRAGDVLFIDSSHVSKTGSDVNHLVFNVLPLLQKGVRIHFHDIFLPDEYPRHWIAEGRSWNEQYLLRALLQYGQAHFRVLFSSAYATRRMPEAIASACAGQTFGGASLWLEKI